MQLQQSTFEYLRPTEDQQDTMEQGRRATRMYADWIDENVPEGPDKTFILRSLRSLAMWINVAITREADGGPRV
jgi:hypothetical protein